MKISPPSLTARDLADRIVSRQTRRLEDIVDRYLPDFVVPPSLAGYPVGTDTRADLAYCLHHLHILGHESVAGTPIIDAHRRILAGVDGPTTVNFYSYRVAELLRAYGPFADNALLATMTPAQRDNLRLATDSSATWEKLVNHGMAANYWAVLARCEYAREQLGILPSREHLDGCIARVTEILGRNPRHFWDDSVQSEGVYDIYSADVLLFLEPLWPLFPAALIDDMKATHVHWAETLAMENATPVAWGRSTGLLGVCMTLEMHAMALHEGIAGDPARSLALAAHAVDAIDDWHDRGLVSAHRGRMTYNYRGPQRLLQMTLDCIGKTLYAARHLAELDVTATPAQQTPHALFPARDEVVVCDDQQATIWMYRDADLTVQLPLIGRLHSDYIAGPRGPGVFETVVDSRHLLTGTPMLTHGGHLYASAGRPQSVQTSPAAITAVYDGFPCVDDPQAAPLAGRREVRWQAAGRGLRVTESWQFAERPDTIEIHACDATTPMVWDILRCDQPHSQRAVAVDGMREFRSFWNQLSRHRTLTIEPAESVELEYLLRPATRVLVVPSPHDYTDALYGAMPEDRLDVTYMGHGRPWNLDVADLEQRFDVLHVGWPESFFPESDADKDAYLARTEAFTQALKASRLKVIWTMHNRLPHRLEHGFGHALYRLWAAAVDGVIHHSEWGRDTMLAELPYRADARHIVQPHGHYGDQMPPPSDLQATARAWELPPVAIRYGVVGRPQAEKQIDMIARAFAATDRDDIGLFISAITPDESLPGDPRIRRRDRKGWLERQEIADQVRVCDALIIAVTGPTYLTSGQTADAIGAGIPMIAIDWPYLRETLGDGAHYFDGSEAALTALLQRLTPADIARAGAAIKASADQYAWPRIAAGTLDLIESVAAADARSPVTP